MTDAGGFTLVRWGVQGSLVWYGGWYDTVCYGMPLVWYGEVGRVPGSEPYPEQGSPIEAGPSSDLFTQAFFSHSQYYRLRHCHHHRRRN